MNDAPLTCYRDTVAHRRPRRILYYAGFIKSLQDAMRRELGLAPEVSLRDHFGMLAPAYVATTPPAGLKSPDFSRYFTGVTRQPDDFINGLGVLETPGGFHHFTHYTSPLRNAASMADLEAFPYPSIKGFSEAGMKATVDEAHARGSVTCAWVGHMYEDSWQIRGYEQFLTDMIDRPEWCDYILDRVKERNLEMARAAAHAEMDWIKTGDDVASQKTMMFSPELWRRFMKPRWAEVFALARSTKPDMQIWYHSDGNIEAIIPELIDIGVTILNPVQPECLDLMTIKRKYGNRLVLDGTIGTQTTMPFGNPEEVSRVVRERARDLGYDGALILSPTHVLEPEVPLENIRAFIETAKTL